MLAHGSSFLLDARSVQQSCRVREMPDYVELPLQNALATLAVVAWLSCKRTDCAVAQDLHARLRDRAMP